MASLEKQQPGLGARPYLINSMPLIFEKELPTDAKHVIFTVDVEYKTNVSITNLCQNFQL